MYLFLRKHRNIKFILILLVSSFPSLFCESAVLSYFSDVVYTKTWTIIFFTTKMMLWWSTASNADQISTYHRASTKKWVWPNMTKLMDNNSSCSVSTVFNNYMASKQSIISKDVIVTNLAIMSYMARTHYKIIITDNRAVARFGRTMNGAVLSDLIFSTNM